MNRKGLSSVAAAVAALTFAAGASAQDSDESGQYLDGGFQAAHVSLGSPVDTIATEATAVVETDSAAPYIVGTLPFAAFELFAKAGYLIYDTEASVTSPLGIVVVDDRGDDFTASAGLGLPLFDTFDMRLESEAFDVQTVDDANALWLTDAFRF